ncbi:MAG: glutaredoxin domain-containing protein [Candidatus Micrarchaeota archaeon]|nr:glutaredoxin domain-containing protein [Candidatus Micrarchaeota archaeon]
MSKKYLLFTSPFCKFCPTIKQFLATVDASGANFDITQDDGRNKALSLNVNKIPTVIFVDEAGNETTRAHNINDIREILSDY